MLSLFPALGWQKMTVWHTYTNGNFGANKLMMWRMNPNIRTYMELPVHFQLTQIQLTMPHPIVIDWVPFPELRDKLILCHSANPNLDEIIREIGNSYVVQTDLSRLVAGFEPGIGYVAMWDMIRTIAPETTPNSTTSAQSATPFCDDDPLDAHGSPESLDDSNWTLPAPSVRALFSSKALAVQAFRLLDFAGAETLRLDPAFFELHPELYDCKVNLMACGTHLKPPFQRVSVPSPNILDNSVLSHYKDFATQTFSLPFEGQARAGVRVA